jgi:glucan phosphoethanolaminetransferase (alkaline phosphatase superfamily)
LKTFIQLVKQYRLSLFLLIISLFLLHYLTGSVCYSVILFGIPCPACGLTRAAMSLAAGHFKESFHMHPLLILVIIGVLLYPLLKTTTRRYKLFMNIYLIITISIFLCFYFYRMYYYYPLMEPMVYHKDNFLAKAITVIQYLKH